MAKKKHKNSITVGFVALGCPKNLIDSEKMLAKIAQEGFLSAADTDDADVVAIGHNHTLYYDRVLRVKMNGRRIVHTIRTGSFLGGTKWQDQPKYARKSSYPLAEIGCPIVKLWHDRKQIRVDMETLVL